MQKLKVLAMLVVATFALGEAGNVHALHEPAVIVTDEQPDTDVAWSGHPRVNNPVLEHSAKGGSTSRSRARGR